MLSLFARFNLPSLFPFFALCLSLVDSASANPSSRLLIANIVPVSDRENTGWMGAAIAEDLEHKLRSTHLIDLVPRYEAHLKLKESGFLLSAVIDEASARRVCNTLDVQVVAVGNLEAIESHFDLEVTLVYSDPAKQSVIIKKEGANLSGIENEIVRKIAIALGYEMSKEQERGIDARITEDSQAYINFAHGVELYYKGEVARALVEFDKAVSLDRGFVRAKRLLSASKREARDLKREARDLSWENLNRHDKIIFIAGYMPRWIEEAGGGGAEPEYHIITAGFRCRLRPSVSVISMFGAFVHRRLGDAPDFTPIQFEVQRDLIELGRMRVLLSPQYILYLNRKSNGWNPESGSDHVHALGLGLAASLSTFSRMNIVLEGVWFFTGSKDWSRTGYEYSDSKGDYVPMLVHMSTEFSGFQVFGGIEIGL